MHVAEGIDAITRSCPSMARPGDTRPLCAFHDTSISGKVIVDVRELIPTQPSILEMATRLSSPTFSGSRILIYTRGIKKSISR